MVQQFPQLSIQYVHTKTPSRLMNMLALHRVEHALSQNQMQLVESPAYLCVAGLACVFRKIASCPAEAHMC